VSPYALDGSEGPADMQRRLRALAASYGLTAPEAP
jgi:hypothetical protein